VVVVGDEVEVGGEGRGWWRRINCYERVGRGRKVLLWWEEVLSMDYKSGVLAVVKAVQHQHQHVFANFTTLLRETGRAA
jgi:hypothetical protein